MYSFAKSTLRKAASCATVLLLAGISAFAGPDLRLKTVVLDPGHGGKDAGCVSADKKTYEKNLVLAISHKFEDRITEKYGSDVRVLMTRSDDRFIPLIDRAKFSTRNNAALFISIHINAQKGGTNANGFSVHLLGQSQDLNKDTYAFNRDVCQRENEVIYLEDDYSTKYQGLSSNDAESEIFLNLMQTAYREQSFLFGQLVSENLGAKGPFRKNNGIMQNNFCVLRLATMPAVLLELGFITNPTDLATLRVPDNLDKIADALFTAFCQFKDIYDSSVAVQKDVAVPDETPAAQPAVLPAAPAPEPAKEQPKNEPVKAVAKEQPEVMYGVQVFASVQEVKAGDRRLLGYEPMVIENEGSKLKKYIIGLSASEIDAKKEFSTIKETYKDSFLVKVEGGKVSRLH